MRNRGENNPSTNPKAIVDGSSHCLQNSNMCYVHVASFPPEVSGIDAYISHGRKHTESLQSIIKNQQRISISNGDGWLPLWFLMGREWLNPDDLLTTESTYKAHQLETEIPSLPYSIQTHPAKIQHKGTKTTLIVEQEDTVRAAIQTNVVKCHGFTKAGKQCKNVVHHGKYCWLHVQQENAQSTH